MSTTRRCYNEKHHFHIRWHGKDEFDWECFESGEMAMARALQLALPGEIFSIEEVRSESKAYDAEDSSDRSDYFALG
jgi:hypothetical protein